jgi:hypothetical protein
LSPFGNVKPERYNSSVGTNYGQIFNQLLWVSHMGCEKYPEPSEPYFPLFFAYYISDRFLVQHVLHKNPGGREDYLGFF